MRDVYILFCALKRYQPDLHNHLSGLGFHPATVFYGAFMRWFAGYMPHATLFRFWDIMFSESTRHKFDAEAPPVGVQLGDDRKPRRHILIDFAYAVLKACIPQLMRCESALEAKDCVLNFIEALYDPSSVAEIVAEAEQELW